MKRFMQDFFVTKDALFSENDLIYMLNQWVKSLEAECGYIVSISLCRFMALAFFLVNNYIDFLSTPYTWKCVFDKHI